MHNQCFTFVLIQIFDKCTYEYSQIRLYLHEAVVDESDTWLEDSDVDDVEQVRKVVAHPPVDPVVVRLVARVTADAPCRHHGTVTIYFGSSPQCVVTA